MKAKFRVTVVVYTERNVPDNIMQNSDIYHDEVETSHVELRQQLQRMGYHVGGSHATLEKVEAQL